MFNWRSACIELSFLVLVFICSSRLVGQSFEGNGGIHSTRSKFDSSYIETFPDRISARLFLGNRYTNFTIEDFDSNQKLTYRPNSSLNLGLGATYKTFTLNLGYGFRFLNRDEGRGETRFLDLQTSIYSRKFVLDIFGQFYKGMYLDNTASFDYGGPDPYYLRSDIYERVFGFTAFYVFNDKRFTYRAALIQNERQLKSTGSFLLGAEFYSGKIEADSSLVPLFVSDGFMEIANARSISFIKGGPSFGYGHTFVIGHRFFVMLSLSVSIGIGRNTVNSPQSKNVSNVRTDASALSRFAIGYNHPRWYIGFSAVNNSIATSTNDELTKTIFGIGRVRLEYVWRIPLPERWKKIANKIPG